MFLAQSSLGKNQWWRYAATMITTLAFFVAGHVPLFFIVTYYAEKGSFSDADLDRLLATGGLDQIGVNSNLALIVMLVPFACALIALLLCIRFLHNRPVRSVLTSRRRFDLKRVGVAALLWFVVAGGIVLWVIPGELLTYQFTLNSFLPLLLIAMLLLPLQVVAEEILFRGYLLQGLSRFFVLPIWPLVIVTFAFAAVHISNPEFQNGFIFIAPVYLVLSLFFGVLAILDGGLELPIGAHLANNLFAALILSTSDGAMNTASIFQTQVSDVVKHLWSLLLAAPVVLCVLQLKYRFDWATLVRTEIQLRSST
ncbi:type II CAAX endopeptidase family protein [Thalassobius sp. I31.1]|uniref:CPBP family intramembrane glutamic endopeptidase n=1 Tax=Thalassobius sp. I31.1 TaxID=2109912 RepID=UPI00130088BC|nr:type II CAAX endopeptidase family protein [Thalassobius sp. I31.1]